jgi:hypothetical protein
LKSGGGKNKGSQFEREVCAKLSLWITGGQRKDCLWRSAMSGGRATVHMKKGEVNRQAGDICAVAPEGHVLTDRWYIECKHYKDLSLVGFFLFNRGTLYNFWKETVKQAAMHKRLPMLIAKQNGIEALVLTQGYAMRTIRLGPPRLRSSTAEVWLLDELLSLPFQGKQNRMDPEGGIPGRAV